MTANISWITDNLATGGDLSYDPLVAAEQAQDIIDQEVQLIIDVRAESNDEGFWDDCGITYLHLPTDDRQGHHIAAELFEKAVVEARHCLDAGEKVLIHCHMGINRGPSVAYAVLLDLDYDPIKAFDLIRAKRDCAAIYYAVDALEAEVERRDFHHPVDIDRLKAHMKSLWTPEEQARIQHILRTNHQNDRETFTRVNAG